MPSFPMTKVTRAAVVGLAQLVGLDHGAHGAVDHGDALAQQRPQARGGVSAHRRTMLAAARRTPNAV